MALDALDALNWTRPHTTHYSPCGRIGSRTHQNGTNINANDAIALNPAQTEEISKNGQIAANGANSDKSVEDVLSLQKCQKSIEFAIDASNAADAPANETIAQTVDSLRIKVRVDTNVLDPSEIVSSK